MGLQLFAAGEVAVGRLLHKKSTIAWCTTDDDGAEKHFTIREIPSTRRYMTISSVGSH
jgi:hypothetical protein